MLLTNPQESESFFLFDRLLLLTNPYEKVKHMCEWDENINVWWDLKKECVCVMDKNKSIIILSKNLKWKITTIIYTPFVLFIKLPQRMFMGVMKNKIIFEYIILLNLMEEKWGP